MLEVDPDFPYARILASTLTEMPNQQLYYAKNLPSLTSIADQQDNHSELQKVMENMAFAWINAYKQI